jgi:ATP-dependent Clp protease ATP-binding subunit ClpX
MKTNKNQTKCSNCGASPKTHADRDFIRDADGLTLCDSCINYFNIAKEQILSTRKTTSDGNIAKPQDLPLVNPEDIYNFLSYKVISQDEAKKSLAIAVAHHYRRLRDPSIGKSNILMIGPTGTGKTELGRGIAEILKVPFISADATSFTTKGYVGEDVDSVITRLLASCNWDKKIAEQGIIFIDEIDKIARRGTGDHNIGTVAVQQELLRLMEGDNVKVNIPNPESPTGHDVIYIDTSKILFICAGAFVGLDDLIKKGSSRPMGINSSNSIETSLVNSLESKHLIQYGIIPEFLGRLPIIAMTHKLNKEDLLKILKDVNNSITGQYQKLFLQDKIELSFSDDFFEDIAEQALAKDLGARGLRQLIETRMKNVFFNIKKYENQKIQITKENVIVLKNKSMKTSLSKKSGNLPLK